MSYCRWSSDDWRCDLYCYESEDGGWTTHVAGRKAIDVPRSLPYPINAPEDQKERLWEEWFVSHKAQMKFLETAEYRTIDLPHAGETFRDYALEDFKDRL